MSTESGVVPSALDRAFFIDDALVDQLRLWGVEADSNGRPVILRELPTGINVEPEYVVNGTDYGGYDYDSRATEVVINRVWGHVTPVETASVRPFAANELGSWLANRHAELRAEKPDRFVLTLANAAAGKNVTTLVPLGEKSRDNKREIAYGILHANGDVSVAINGDDLPQYLRGDGDTVVELPLLDTGTQARGRDILAIAGYQFAALTRHPQWLERSGLRQVDLREVPSKAPDAEPVALVHHELPKSYRDNIPLYYLVDGPPTTADPERSIIPVPPNNLRAAGYAAALLGNGTQALRPEGDLRNVPSISIIAPEGHNPDATVRVWAQRQLDGSIIVGPDEPRAWQLTPGDRPVYDTGVEVPAHDLVDVAYDLFTQLERFAEHEVDRASDLELTLKTGEVTETSADPYGNTLVVFVEPDGEELFSVGDTLVAPGVRGNAPFPVRATLFDAEAARSISDVTNPNCRAASRRSSGGGWLQAVRAEDGSTILTPLKGGQLVVRTITDELQSGAHVLGFPKNANGVHEVPDGLTVAVIHAARVGTREPTSSAARQAGTRAVEGAPVLTLSPQQGPGLTA